MIKKTKSFLSIFPSFIITTLILFEPTVVSAAGNYVPLTPGGEALGLSGVPSIHALVNTIFKNALLILGILAVIMIIRGGAEYMSSSIFNKGTGKTRLTNAIGGIVLALCAWLILQTINPQLLNVTLNFVDPGLGERGVTGVEGVLGVEGVYDPTIRDIETDYTGGDGDWRGFSDVPTTADEQSTRQWLSDYGITVNNDDPSITSVAGFRQSTFDGIEELVRATGSGFRITGGTESGHAAGTYSHSNGYKIDIGLGAGSIEQNRIVDAYIKNKIGVQNPVNNTNYDLVLDNGQQTRARYEGNHWDVTFYPHKDTD